MKIGEKVRTKRIIKQWYEITFKLIHV